MLNVNVGGVFDAIFDRIEELIAQESVYRVVVNDNRFIVSFLYADKFYYLIEITV